MEQTVHRPSKGMGDHGHPRPALRTRRRRSRADPEKSEQSGTESRWLRQAQGKVQGCMPQACKPPERRRPVRAAPLPGALPGALRATAPQAPSTAADPLSRPLGLAPPTRRSESRTILHKKHPAECGVFQFREIYSAFSSAAGASTTVSSAGVSAAGSSATSSTGSSFGWFLRSFSGVLIPFCLLESASLTQLGSFTP